MVADLQEVDRRQRAPREEGRLDGSLGVAGEKRGEPAVTQEEDEGAVVDVALRERRCRIRGRRVDHLDRRGAVEDDRLAGNRGAHREPAIGCIGQQAVVRGILESDPGVEQPANLEAVEDVDEPGDVVLVGMAEDQEVDAPRPERQVGAEPPERELRVRPPVDQHGGAGRGLDQDRIALADV